MLARNCLVVAALAISMSAACAQDMFDWSGFYVGANGSYAYGPAHNASVVPAPGQYYSDTTISGFGVGVHAGANHQMGNFVLGVEGDIGWSGVAGVGGFIRDPGNGGPLQPQAPSERTTIDMLWDGSIRARLGFTNEQWMFFVTGGGSVAQFHLVDEHSMTDGIFTGNVTLLGATAGIGASFAVTDTVILTGEVRHTRYAQGKADLVGATGAIDDITFDASTTKALLGISFKMQP